MGMLLDKQYKYQDKDYSQININEGNNGIRVSTDAD